MTDFDERFKYRDLIVRVSQEAWTDTNMLNKNKSQALRIADEKIARGEIQNGEVLILSKDVVSSRT